MRDLFSGIIYAVVGSVGYCLNAQGIATFEWMTFLLVAWSFAKRLMEYR
jgi:hypothetical protein